MIRLARPPRGGMSKVGASLLAACVVCSIAAMSTWSFLRGRLGATRCVGDDSAMALFIIRSLMDTYPPVSSGDDDNNGIPLNRIVIYPTGHTDDNAPSVADGVLEAREALSSTGTARAPAKVLIHEVINSKLEPPIPNFSGTAHTQQLLRERGVVDSVEMLPGWHDEYTGMNSLNELERLVRVCRERGIKALVVVSTPYHVTRSFLSGLSVASRLYPELAVYAKVARPAGAGYWEEVVAHSQGTLVGSRNEFVASEMERIRRYTQKGDLIPVSEALSMLSRRDGYH